MKQLILILLLGLFLYTAQASTALNASGAVPKDDSRSLSTDLFYNGKTLLASEGLQLKKQGVDLSTLNPKESDLWKNEKKELGEPQLEIQKGESLDYLSFVLSRSGNFRFSALKESSEGRKVFNILLSKKAHNVLLRSALLKKLGFAVPEMKHVESLEVRFASAFEKENFLGRLAEDTLGDTTRWVKESTETTLVLQDVIAMEAQANIYNLAIGSVPAGIIQGRRILNSLLVPFTLVDVPESVNLMTWEGFSVVSNNIRFDYEGNDDFTPSFDDVKWMARKIATLTREDFSQIVAFARFPEAVSKLVVEKLISRRNILLLMSDLSYSVLPYNADVSLNPDLVKGKLTKENWEGYASRFAYGDPESPLSSSEVFTFLRKKSFSMALDKLISMANEKLMPQTDMEKEIYEKQQKIAEDNFARFLETGKISETPVQAFIVPHYNTNIILSRDIITGSYLGTDNTVQLADTLGVGVSLGAYVGVENLPSPWQGNANVKAYFLRRYSHVKPIQSMKIKAPWKNIIVPWLKADYGRVFNNVVKSAGPSLEAQGILTQEGEDLKQLSADIEAGLSPEEGAERLKLRMGSFEQTVVAVSDLIKEEKLTRAEEVIDESEKEIKGLLKNDKEEEVLSFMRSVLEGLPSFENPERENSKKLFQESFGKKLEDIAKLSDAKERRKELSSVLEDWTGTRKVMASFLSLEDFEKRVAFVAEVKDALSNPENLSSIITTLNTNIESLIKDLNTDRASRMKNAFETLKKDLSIGESLIITDSLGAGMDANVGYGITALLRFLGGVNASHAVISRLHIIRTGENSLQIYKDLGNVTGAGLRFEFRAGVPVVTLSGKLSKGVATTKFFQLSLDESDTNAAGKVAVALQGLFKHNSLEMVQAVRKPYVLEHHFTEKRNDFSLLFLEWAGLKTDDSLVIKHPDGGKERQFYKRISSKRFGADLESFFFNVGNFFVSMFTKGFSIDHQSPDDPAQSFFGKGFVRVVSLESELVEGKLAHPVVNLNYTWKGWIAKAKQVKKIVKKLNERFGANLFMPDMLKDTASLQLYQIICNAYIYEEGVLRIAKLPEASLRYLFTKYFISSGDEEKDQEDIQNLVYWTKNYQTKFLTAMSEGKIDDASRFGEKMVSLLESYIPMSDLKLVAGEKNFIVTARIQGFRKGDENGDRPLVSNSWGEIGDKYPLGPITATKNALGMTEAEFFGQWIMGRL